MKGFSLLEIMVTIAIISIMAGSVVVGFSSFGQTVRVRETAGVISDTVKNLELEMIRREYDKQIVHFEEDFLVIEARPEGQSLKLNWMGMGGGSCDDDMGRIEVDNSGSPDTIFLAKRDQYGNNLEIVPIGAGMAEDRCVDFYESEETAETYQLFKGSDRSQAIRFIHFNIRRGDLSSNAQVTAGNNYTLELNAPYAAKQYYDGGIPANGTIQLTLSTQDSNETITLQQ